MSFPAKNNEQVPPSLLDRLGSYAGWIIIAECFLYAVAFHAVMPESMYFSPDSIAYLSITQVVPPTFSLLARGLVEFELWLGSDHVVLLRYLVIALYSVGGWLIARALRRAGSPLLACLVVPVLWSANSLIYWFNYLLTEGIATAFLIICIGTYANLHVTITQGENPASIRRWMAAYIGAGMLAFSMRPAFLFVAPVMVAMLMSRAIFSWRRVAAAIGGIATFAVLLSLFTLLWHGKMPRQSGGVLTALVFDLPLPEGDHGAGDDAAVRRVQQAVAPFTKKYNEISSDHQRLLYKALNNIEVVQPAIFAAIAIDDPKHVLSEADVVQASPILTRIAVRKIRNNLRAYFTLVIKGSYYSVKQWGDWYRNDFLGPEGAPISALDGTKAVASRVREKAGIDFDPTISTLPPKRFYTNYLFQIQRVLLNGEVVAKYTPIFFLLLGTFCIVPFFVRTSAEGSILFACCLFSIAGLVFQNGVFPVIPRLLAPFHPLWLLAFLIYLAFSIQGAGALLNRWRSARALDSRSMTIT